VSGCVDGYGGSKGGKLGQLSLQVGSRGATSLHLQCALLMGHDDLSKLDGLAEGEKKEKVKR
jgi:hypothetical protein